MIRVILSLLLAAVPWHAARAQRPPNVVLIMADDLGVAEVGCYGQSKIRTPHIDELAADGMRFTQAYAGSCVCAPTRCTLLTGLHTGHSFVRDNFEVGGWNRGDPEGQLPLPADTATLARLLQASGYATCCVGKWGLGGPGSSGEPLQQGFDRFFGYLCQRQAHNYYPEHLWRDRDKVVLEGNAWKNLEGAHYAPDLMIDEAVEFVDAHADQPFFLYFATPVPHVAIQVPADSLAEYAGAWDDPAYDGSKGYLPHPSPRAGYAAMVTRMDRDIGRLLARIDELGLREDTIVLFTSDNGPTFNGGSDSAFFDSAGGLRGLKCSLHEGGIRAPLIARWPGHVEAGAVRDHVCALWDVLPTVAALAGCDAPAAIDGVSFAPTLLGRGEQPTHDALYWEYHARGGSQAARIGRFKGIRKQIARAPDAPLELYDLEADPYEQHDVAGEHPDVVARIEAVFAARTPSHLPNWNFGPTWRPQTSGVDASLRGLAVVSPRIAWASGVDGTVLRTVDAGKTWTRHAVRGGEPLDFRSIAAFDAERAMVLSAGQPARLYRTTDGGATFELAWTCAHEGAFFDTLRFIDRDRGIAFSDPVEGEFLVMATADGGDTWKRILGTPEPLAGEAGFAASNSCVWVGDDGRLCIATGGGARARVLRAASVDAPWSAVETPIRAGAASAGVFSIAFADSKRGAVVGGDYLEPAVGDDAAAFTTDGGATWRSPTSMPSGYRSAVAAVPGRATLVAVGPTGADLSPDAGATWRSLGEATGYHAIQFAPGRAVGWAVGAGGKIARVTF